MPTDIDGINVVAFFSPKRRGIGGTHAAAELLARYNIVISQILTSSLTLIYGVSSINIKWAINLGRSLGSVEPGNVQIR